MPQVDMPLEELKRYAGKSPRPADYDVYWARALSVLAEQSLAYTLEPAELSVPG
ncbi:MAG: acetylxylan esterase, partial [Ruthenibacterium sp.]